MIQWKNIRFNLRVGQNGRFKMDPVYLGGGTLVSTGGKISGFRLSKCPNNILFRTFFSPKLSLESWILHCPPYSFSKYLRDITLGVSIIVYSVPQHFSWFQNCKLYWFSNSLLTLLSLALTQFVPYLTQIYCSWWRW